MQVAVLNGVNLDMLGRRDPAVYGAQTLDALETSIYAWGVELGMRVRCFQTNSEGAYVELVHDACEWATGIVVNPGAWTHYSYAIHDALDIFQGPIVEVHLSDVEKREEWRRRSVIADLAAHRIIGRGAQGYREALQLLSGREA